MASYKPMPRWMEGLIGKVFLWQQSTANYKKEEGVPLPRDPKLPYKRPGARDIREFLQGLLPKSEKGKEFKLPDGTLLQLPGGQATDTDTILKPQKKNQTQEELRKRQREHGEVRRIQRLTRNCYLILRNIYSEKHFELTEAPELVQGEDLSYLRALESTDRLGSNPTEKWQGYPMFLFDHYSFKPLVWNATEIKVAQELKGLLGWPGEFTPEVRNNFFLPHPVTGRLISGEIAIIKELSLRRIAKELSLTRSEKEKTKSAKKDIFLLELDPDFKTILESGSILADVNKLLLNRPWASDSYRLVDPVSANQYPWSSWGKTSYTSDIPVLMARYKYSPILLDVTKRTSRTSKDFLGPSELVRLVENFVHDCNGLIIHNQYQKESVRDTKLRKLIEERQDITKKVEAATPVVNPERLDEPEFGSFFDLHMLPDICLFAEAVSFLNSMLIHTLMHLSNDQSIGSNNDAAKNERGTFCVKCKFFVYETSQLQFEKYANQITYEEPSGLAVDSDVKQLIKKRSNHFSSWAW